MGAPITQATEPASGRLDALSEAFVHLAEYANVNTNQIFVVWGALDAGALARSIAKAVAAIPLLRTSPDTASGTLTPSAAAQGQLLWQREFGAPCDFADPAFRQLLMDFSHTMRLDWRDRTPIQVLLVSGVHGATSCVYVSTHHGVADARSDCLLLQAIMGYYAHEMGAPSKAFPALPFHSLHQIRPAWYAPFSRIKRWLGAALCIGRDILSADRGMAVPRRGGRWESKAADLDIGRLDFSHRVLPQALEERLKRAAKAGGVTINTVLSGALVRTLEHSSAGATGKIRLTCAVSLRRLIDPAYDTSFRNYLVASNIRVTPGLATKALLADLQQAVHHARSAEAIQTELGRLELLLPLLRIRPLAGLALALVSRAQVTNACFSNPGVIEEDFSRFGLAQHPTLQYVGFGCLIPPYDFILYTPTVNGRMQLDLVFRRSCFPDIEASFITVFHAALSAILDDLLGRPALTHPTAYPFL